MIDIVMGCQYGSEGKGLIADILAQQNEYEWLISVNSAQAGHTVYFNPQLSSLPEDQTKVVTRQLPSACINNHSAKIYIGSGALINPSVLDEEIEMLEALGIPIKNRLFISEQATIISAEDIQEEEDSGLQSRVGSTCEGVGSAQKNRVMRKAIVAREFYRVFNPSLYEGKFTLVKRWELTDLNLQETKILLEGSQGYQLSLYDDNYPYTTSRPISVPAFLAYAELPPFNINDIYGVFRTFPIRVGGNSGHLPEEMTWEEVAEYSGYPELAEYTTVTKRLRRIGKFNTIFAERAINMNQITHPILTFVNYYDSKAENCTTYEDLSERVKENIRFIEGEMGIKFYMLSTSRYGHHIIQGEEI